jgi:hypothetical protein
VLRKRNGHTLPIPRKCVSLDTLEPISNLIVGLIGACSKHARAKFSTWRMS